MKKIELNTSDKLSQLKESFNKVIDREINKKMISEKLGDMNKLSFCESKVLFDTLLDKLYEDKTGKKLIKSYVKLLKENKSVNSVYRIMESLDKFSALNPTLTAYLMCNICSKLNNKQLVEGEKKMGKILKEAVSVTNLSYDNINNILDENKNIIDCVSYLSHNKVKSSNLNECINKISLVIDVINENKVSNISETTHTDKKATITELNNLLDNKLSSWENRVIMDLSICEMRGGDKSSLFETYKSDCISTIDNMLDEENIDETSRLFSMKQQLMEKKYSEETLIDDLFRMSELKETLINE